jgi:hypothetical protein
MPELYIAPDKEHPDDVWRVEDVDADGDGSCAILFIGFDAEPRAREYFE